MSVLSRSWKYGQAQMPYIPRSRQNLSHGVHTSMPIGRLVPIDWQEVYPGDIFQVKSFNVSRLVGTFARPVMDELYLDVYHFFVPYRLVFSDFESVFGDPNPSAYTEPALATMPNTYGVVSSRSVADYLGLPITTLDSDYNQVSVAPFRGLALIYDKYFRNQNTVDEMVVQKGDFASSEVLNNNPWAPNNYTGQLPYVRKLADYFVTALPQPQKGLPVNLSLGASAPVSFRTTSDPYKLTGQAIKLKFSDEIPLGQFAPLLSASESTHDILAGTPTSTQPGTINPAIGWNIEGSADLSQATMVNVNDLRLAFATQKMLERDAIFGSRYNSYILAHFGEYIKDETIQFPQYLGGGRITMNQVQVAQTNARDASSEESPVGTLSAYTWTQGKSRFSHKFPEHGMLFTVACIRYHHTYQQGIAKKWRRFQKSDFYDPLYATIGMMPIERRELFVSNNPNIDSGAFGYREAYAELRMVPNSITGQMRTGVPNSLDVYHFGDNYSSSPLLSESFTNETAQNVQRTLTTSEDQDPFVFDFWFDMRAVRRMPVDSMPGFIDHW